MKSNILCITLNCIYLHCMWLLGTFEVDNAEEQGVLGVVE